MRRISLLLLIIPGLSFSQVRDNLVFIINHNPVVATDQEQIYTSENDTKPSVVSSVMRVMITFYQRYLSIRDVRVCQFNLSCSNYGMRAISDYGPFWGTLMTNDRLLRCNPFAHGHYPHAPGRQDLVVDRPMQVYDLRAHYLSEVSSGSKPLKKNLSL